MGVLADHYHLNLYIAKTVRRTYTNISGWAIGHDEYFAMMMGIKQGCSLSPTLFSLYFDCITKACISTAILYDEDPIDHKEWITGVAHLAIYLALYTDDLALIVSSVDSLQT